MSHVNITYLHTNLPYIKHGVRTIHFQPLGMETKTMKMRPRLNEHSISLLEKESQLFWIVKYYYHTVSWILIFLAAIL